jgi:hypothetical protein
LMTVATNAKLKTSHLVRFPTSWVCVAIACRCIAGSRGECTPTPPQLDNKTFALYHGTTLVVP